jgi:hypothetical protein
MVDKMAQGQDFLCSILTDFLSLMLYNMNNSECHEITCLKALHLNPKSIASGAMMFFPPLIYCMICRNVTGFTSQQVSVISEEDMNASFV